ncbi:hypothetical protein GCM10011611_56260 [Aliidongia dinghuensis]|uniref:DUF485 domain-containing protein n=1 Tax=Aliidongia dinghuensis TaxID=1867774 RepID=A0A8J3E7J5_9PROT|nr:DUF485 domain-containing protein [Aliidongia dinghuensis]GGF42560.1 hypothetical protein GCM10011611_56260 [Aliidongia dinghuensis]
MVEDVVTYGEVRPIALDHPSAVAELVAKKLRFVGLMTLIYMVSYVGLTVLAGFARALLSAPAIGPVNLGFVLIGANYLIAWGLALIYVRVANRHFDPLADRILGRQAP